MYEEWVKEFVKVFESITLEFPILGTYFYSIYVLKISKIALTAVKVYEECVNVLPVKFSAWQRDITVKNHKHFGAFIWK